MTSINHTLVAGIAAVASDEKDLATKAIILILLVSMHIVFDAVPHWHFYSFVSFVNIKKAWRKELVKSGEPESLLFGLFFEVGIAFLLLPVVIYYFTGVSLVWLFLCVIAASLVDILVALNVTMICKINEKAHWWYSRAFLLKNVNKFEIAQTLLLISIFFTVNL